MINLRIGLKRHLHPFKKKYHKEFYALNDVSFEIKKGETVGTIGKKKQYIDTIEHDRTFGILQLKIGNKK